MKKLLFLSLFVLFAFSAYAQAVPFALTVTDIKSDKGNIMIAVCADAEEFKTDDACKYKFSVPAKKGSITQTIEVPSGSYGIKVYHDENNNNILDTAMFGKPKEYYGFSNNKYGAFGSKPDFQEAIVNIDGKTSASIKLRK